MKIVLQYTTGAFSGEIPEGQWRDVSEHRKVTTAKDAQAEALMQMRERCGPGAWDSHYRLINAGVLPIKWSVPWLCTGWNGHLCYEQEAVEIVWNPGESEPKETPPDGWNGTQCPGCRLQQAEYCAL